LRFSFRPNAEPIAHRAPSFDFVWCAAQILLCIQRENPKYGFYVNAEQQIMKDVGIFARASWNDGQNQVLSFTDIDRSVSVAFRSRAATGDVRAIRSESAAPSTGCPPRTAISSPPAGSAC